MEEHIPPAKENRMDFSDILFVLFKHKWKILTCAAVGFLATAIYLVNQSENEFQAKLLVRYVLERSAIDPVDPQVKTINASMDAENVINSEVEILTSVDLAEQVAEAVGIEKLRPGAESADRRRDAARKIAADLKVTALRNSNVILVSYRNRDPNLAKRVLEELVSRYFDKHLQVHRSLGAFDFVSRQTDQVRARLHQTEEELKELKAKAGIASLAESTSSIAAELTKSQSDLHAAQVELAEQRARVREVERAFTGASPDRGSAGVTMAAAKAGQQYEMLGMELAQLRGLQVNLLGKFTPENRAVQVNRAQIANLEARRRELEASAPGVIASPGGKGGVQGPGVSLLSEQARLAAMEARTAALEVQMREALARADRLAGMGTQIAQLERNRDLEENNYKYFEASLEKARVDEALDPSKIPNISIVQKPSAAVKNTGRMAKGVLVLAGGGLAAGLMLAFLIELVLDPTVTRAKQLELRCGVPLLLAIPETGQESENTVPPTAGDGVGRLLEDAPKLETTQNIRSYFADIRDRLAMYFELNGITRQPKLVAVAAMADGGGASTVAAGLAAALSETGDGRVLLVDMNLDHANAAPFAGQRPVRSLVEALALKAGGKSRAAQADNLCLATVGQANSWEGQVIPKKFYDLMPEMKSSEFDYIIFDMPPLNRSSAALAMAGLMDKLLLVVEAERSNRDAVVRAHGELLAARANVSVILNKCRSYRPKWFQDGVQ